jgi:glutathione synthase/RimK-type ligase-like ATP-grasp enzyme
LHLAIAQRWDVHYFSAAMANRADYRAEEARFLADPVAVLGSRAWDALGRVRDALELEYAGVDFALSGDGRIVVFEANAAMTVLRPDEDERFAYRHAASEALAAALVQMFRRRII